MNWGIVHSACRFGLYPKTLYWLLISFKEFFHNPKELLSMVFFTGWSLYTLHGKLSEIWATFLNNHTNHKSELIVPDYFSLTLTKLYISYIITQNVNPKHEVCLPGA
jgi:hypothetical protein